MLEISREKLHNLYFANLFFDVFEKGDEEFNRNRKLLRLSSCYSRLSEISERALDKLIEATNGINNDLLLLSRLYHQNAGAPSNLTSFGGSNQWNLKNWCVLDEFLYLLSAYEYLYDESLTLSGFSTADFMFLMTPVRILSNMYDDSFASKLREFIVEHVKEQVELRCTCFTKQSPRKGPASLAPDSVSFCYLCKKGETPNVLKGLIPPYEARNLFQYRADVLGVSMTFEPFSFYFFESEKRMRGCASYGNVTKPDSFAVYTGYCRVW